MTANAYSVEPAFKSIFRLFVSLRVVYSILLLIASTLILRLRIGLAVGFGLGIFIWVLLYLSSDLLERRLGRGYYPLALSLVSLALILERELIDWRLAIQWQEYLSNSTLLRGAFLALPIQAVLNNSSTPMIFVPLVLIAWQYNFRSVVIFTVSTMLVYVVMFASPWGVATAGPVEFLLVLLGRALAFCMVGYTVVHLSRALRVQRNALRDANARLVNHLTVQEHLATSQERNRLARELHDTMAHSLSATTIQLEASAALWESNPSKAHDLMQHALQTTRAGLTETRRALELLRASPLEDMGLLLSLRQLADESGERSGYQLELKLPAALDTLSPQAEQTVYRCAQETLSNIARHAAARRVQVQLAQQNGQVELTIRDDGRGFDPANVDRSRSFGLMGMQERVEMLGGRLDIASQPGQGTTVHLTIGTAR